MPDISMCRGTGCDRADECYRAQAQPNPARQSYFAIEPMDEYGDCNYFVPLNEASTPLKEKTRV